MKKYLIAIVLAVFMLGSVPIMAQQQYPDKGQPELDLELLKSMNSTARNAYIEAQIKKAEAAAEAAATNVVEKKDEVVEMMDRLDPEKVRAWGTLLGEGISAVCNSLNVEVNKFIRTPVGMFLAAVVVYKVAGDDMIELIEEKIFGPIGLLFTLGIIWFSYTRCFGVRKLKRTRYEPIEGSEKTTKVVEHYTEPRVNWNPDKDGKATTAVLHGIAAFIAILVGTIIIL